ncbi:MAG: hypothetical protein M0R73_01150 [Dehalococcoidia bacterium]|nr:hypothetical protein [Dehalococcoidia bacterium]
MSALNARLPPNLGRLLRASEAAARATQCDLWAVGGVVRDLALGTPVNDLDLAVRGSLDALVTEVARRTQADPALVKHEARFGTASVSIDGARLDLAHLRAEDYVAPGALPVVRPTDSLEADLHRRDFTVNAMAFGLVGADRGRLVDPHGGLADLESRTLRVLHERSFEDDATRLWRGARTAALFRLAPDATTLRLIEAGARWLEPISGERLWAEFANTARRRRSGRAVDLLDEWGTLRGAHPQWTLPTASRAALRRRGPMPAARLAAVLLAPLPQAAREAILLRLSAPREARQAVADAARLLEAGRLSADGIDPARLAGLEGVHAKARTAAAWLAPEEQAPLQRELRRWERTRPPLTAEQLLALGVPRGPAVGQALAGLRRARYLGTLGSGADVRRNARAAIRRRMQREAGLADAEGWD